MNIQTEHLENHTARLTVEVEAERLDKAMRQAARTLSQKGRIPGFRPGKAPMNVVIRMYGREYVVGEAIEIIGDEIYAEALKESEIQPYGPGSLEKINEEDGLKLTFVVPKRPEVTLGDYRAIRIEPEVPEVTDEMVTRAMESLREEQALIEPAHRPVQLGDKVTFEHIEIVVLPAETDEDAASDGEAESSAPAESEAAAEEADDEAGSADDEEEEDHSQERLLLHQHNYEYIVRDDGDDLLPGFGPQIVGMNAGDEKLFTLVVPEDFKQLEDVAGRTVRCEVHLKDVSSRILPDWTDELAERVSQGEQKTMLELRMDVRKRLQEDAENFADRQVAEQALEKLVEDATVHYPPEIVDEYIDDMLSELDSNMRQQGLTLADFMKITGRDEQSLREQYHERAELRARRALALGQLIHDEQLDITDQEVDSEVDRMSTLLGGDQADRIREILNSGESRVNISNRLVSDRALERLVAIAKGENPPVGAVPGAESNETTPTASAEDAPAGEPSAAETAEAGQSEAG